MKPASEPVMFDLDLRTNLDISTPEWLLEFIALLARHGLQPEEFGPIIAHGPIRSPMGQLVGDREVLHAEFPFRPDHLSGPLQVWSGVDFYDTDKTVERFGLGRLGFNHPSEPRWSVNLQWQRHDSVRFLWEQRGRHLLNFAIVDFDWSFAESEKNLERLVHLMEDIADLTKAVFGRAADTRFPRGGSPEEGLPPVAWMNVYGPPYVTLAGTDRLLAAPSSRASILPYGGIMVVADERPWPCFSRNHSVLVRKRWFAPGYTGRCDEWKAKVYGDTEREAWDRLSKAVDRAQNAELDRLHPGAAAIKRHLGEDLFAPEARRTPWIDMTQLGVDGEFKQNNAGRFIREHEALTRAFSNRFQSPLRLTEQDLARVDDWLREISRRNGTLSNQDLRELSAYFGDLLIAVCGGKWESRRHRVEIHTPSVVCPNRRNSISARIVVLDAWLRGELLIDRFHHFTRNMH